MSSEAHRPRPELLLKKEKDSKQTSPDIANGTITTFDNRSLANTRPDDILDVNLEQVKRVLQEMILRIEHEGELETSDVADAILLVVTTLRHLVVDQELVRKSLARTPKANLIHYLISLWPSEGGAKIRKIISERSKTVKEERALDSLVQDITELRISLDEAVDNGIHRKLLSTNKEYLDFSRSVDKNEATLGQAEEILSGLHTLCSKMDLVRNSEHWKECSNSFSDWVEFYVRLKCQPKLQYHFGFQTVQPENLVIGIKNLINELNAEIKETKDKMRYMRDQEKEKIYKKSRNF